MTEKFNNLNTTHTHVLTHTQKIENDLSNSSKKIESLNLELSTARQEFERLSVINLHLDDNNKMQSARIIILENELKSVQDKERIANEESKKAIDKVQLLMNQIVIFY